ncbi:exosortase-associated protein EpsI, V-type [Gimibacter soli]|uniref:EpsI family protein n=1 Tax=Gimibacter soli TaxID=3024400 RepID=A0AAF0BG46_9PROT|nr:exosortase-associated protein EpsI, V-type [Gimibacter soli]WCL53173.1 EpsI family protein [Gimibacter soli]
MKLPGLQVLLAAALILLGGLASWRLTPTEMTPILKDNLQIADILPETFGDWTVDERIEAVRPLEQSTLADAIYDQSITKGYRNTDGELVMVLIAYGANQSDTLQLHRPDVCYIANGFRITSNFRKDVDLKVPGRDITLPSVRMMTINGQRYEPVTFWTRVGDAIPVKTLERQWDKLKYGLSGRIPDGLLVRISTISRDEESAYDLHDQFARDLLAALPANALPLFIGAQGEELDLSGLRAAEK